MGFRFRAVAISECADYSVSRGAETYMGVVQVVVWGLCNSECAIPGCRERWMYGGCRGLRDFWLLREGISFIVKISIFLVGKVGRTHFHRKITTICSENYKIIAIFTYINCIVIFMKMRVFPAVTLESSNFYDKIFLRVPITKYLCKGKK